MQLLYCWGVDEIDNYSRSFLMHSQDDPLNQEQVAFATVRDCLERFVQAENLVALCYEYQAISYSVSSEVR